MGKNDKITDMNISYSDLLALNNRIRKDVIDILNEYDECEEILGELGKEYKEIFKSERTLLEDVRRLMRENSALKAQIAFIEKHGQSMKMSNASACISIIMGVVIIIAIIYHFLKNNLY